MRLKYRAYFRNTVAAIIVESDELLSALLELERVTRIVEVRSD